MKKPALTLLAIFVTSSAFAADAGIDRPGQDYTGFRAANAGRCEAACMREEKCGSWAFRASDGACWLKEGVPSPVGNPAITSGTRFGN